MKTVIILTPIYILLISLLNGCSLIGFSIGSQIDNSDSKEMLPSRHSISSLKAGSDLDIVLYNQNNVSGKYIGSDSLKSLDIEVGTTTLEIPLNDIKLIRKSSSYTGRVIGGVAGLVLDIIVLRFVASSMSFGTFLK
jgi:hypothetical protein